MIDQITSCMNDCTNLLRSARPLELDFELKKESSRPITKAGQASVLVVQESRVSDHGHCCCGVEARQGLIACRPGHPALCDLLLSGNTWTTSLSLVVSICIPLLLAVQYVAHHSESTTRTWLLMITSLIIRLVSLIDPACNEVNLTAGNGIVRFGQFCVALTYYSTIKSSLSTLKHMMILVPFRVFCTINICCVSCMLCFL